VTLARHPTVGTLLAMVLVAVGLGGCGLRGPRPTLPPLSAETLLARLAARRTEVTSLRARARVHAGLQGRWVRQAFLVRRPDAVRIDVLSPFGLVLALGARDDLMWAYPPADRVRYEGAATPDNLARFLGTPVVIEDIVDILLGTPPVRKATGRAQIESTPEHEYRVALPIEGGTQTIWFAADTLFVVRAEESHADGSIVRLAFGEYQDGFPRALEVRAQDASPVKLDYEAVETNVALDPQLFAPPPALRVLPLESARGAETR
jgi:outer membrane lipoprotein-sorting protein